MTKLMYRKTYKCGDYVEVYDYEKPVAYGFNSKREYGIRRALKKRGDNVARARKRLIRLALANSKKTRPLFITLTYALSELDRDVAVRDAGAFFRKLRARYPHAGYLYTLERQVKRGYKEGNAGSWHIHALVFNVPYAPIDFLEKIWRKGNGVNSVDIEKNKKMEDAKHVAFYIAKYITKDKHEADGNKRVFNSSLNLLSPEEFRHFLFDNQFISGKQLVYSGGYFNALNNFINVRIYYNERE